MNFFNFLLIKVIFKYKLSIDWGGGDWEGKFIF